ncbi:hypothetical protein ACS0TY_011103 [Phlomoides rotata]
MEYWIPSVLGSMAAANGTLLQIDTRTLQKTMGIYARMLVEIDLKQELETKIMFVRVGHQSFTSVEYEKLPAFCTICGIVGHTLASCNSEKGKHRR